MHQAQDDNLWYVYFQTLNKNQFSISAIETTCLLKELLS